MRPRSLAQGERAIKGPGLRVGLDVRRVWECPRCGRQRRTSGDTVAQLCCADAERGEAGVWMRLVEERRVARPSGPVPIHEIPSDDAPTPAASEPETPGAETP